MKVIVLERVHLFANNIGVAADGASEKIGWLEDGRANFAEAEGTKDGSGCFFNVIPKGGVRRKKVACAANGLKFAALLFFWCGVGQFDDPLTEGALKRRPYINPLQNAALKLPLQILSQADSLRYNNPSVAWPSATSWR